jgi:hypothetical protein
MRAEEHTVASTAPAITAEVYHRWTIETPETPVRGNSSFAKILKINLSFWSLIFAAG